MFLGFTPFILFTISSAAFFAIASSIGFSSSFIRSFSSLMRISKSETTICLRTPFFCAIMIAASAAIFFKRAPLSLNAFVCSIAAAISGFLTSTDEPNSLRNAAITESGMGGDCSIKRSSSIRQIFKKDIESIRSFGFKRSSTQIKRLNLPHEMLETR